jgi:hypothetical protein
MGGFEIQQFNQCSQTDDEGVELQRKHVYQAPHIRAVMVWPYLIITRSPDQEHNC